MPVHVCPLPSSPCSVPEDKKGGKKKKGSKATAKEKKQKAKDDDTRERKKTRKEDKEKEPKEETEDQKQKREEKEAETQRKAEEKKKKNTEFKKEQRKGNQAQIVLSSGKNCQWSGKNFLEWPSAQLISIQSPVFGCSGL